MLYNVPGFLGPRPTFRQVIDAFWLRAHARTLSANAYVTHDMLLLRMGTLVQIRDVPEEVHRTLKSRAAAAGVSLSEYLRTVLERTASRPTPAELAARIQMRGATKLSQPSEQAVRSLRDGGE